MYITNIYNPKIGTSKNLPKNIHRKDGRIVTNIVFTKNSICSEQNKFPSPETFSQAPLAAWMTLRNYSFRHVESVSTISEEEDQLITLSLTTLLAKQCGLHQVCL